MINSDGTFHSCEGFRKAKTLDNRMEKPEDPDRYSGSKTGVEVEKTTAPENHTVVSSSQMLKVNNLKCLNEKKKRENKKRPTGRPAEPGLDLTDLFELFRKEKEATLETIPGYKVIVSSQKAREKA